MAYEVNSQFIGLAWDAVNAPPVPFRHAEASQAMRDIADRGWASKFDVEHLLWAMDARLDRADLDLDALVGALRLSWRPMYPRPRGAEKEVFGTFGMSAPDAASILISLMHLGFNIDPTLLVERLKPAIARKETVTDSELSLLWFQKGKRATVTLKAEGRLAGPKEVVERILPSGFLAELWRWPHGEPILLTIQPRRRDKRAPLALN